MFGIAVGRFHIAPNDFWNMTFREYCSVYFAVNPINKRKMTNKPFFSADEKRRAQRLKERVISKKRKNN